MLKTVVEEFRRLRFIDAALCCLEDNYISKEFYAAVRSGMSLNQYYGMVEPDKSQRGTRITPRITEAFSAYLTDADGANKFFLENNSPLRVVTQPASKLLGDETLSYDIVFEDIRTAEQFKVELKISQNAISWSGSTSTTNKVPETLLLNVVLARDMVLSPGINRGFFKGVFAAMINLDPAHWVGAPRDNNHRSELKLRMDTFNASMLREQCVLKGDVLPKRVYYHFEKPPVCYSGSDVGRWEPYSLFGAEELNRTRSYNV